MLQFVRSKILRIGFLVLFSMLHLQCSSLVVRNTEIFNTGKTGSAKINYNSSMVHFTTIAEGCSDIQIHATTIDTEGCVYLAGSIPDTPRISFFPIGGDIPGFDTTFNGGSDGFVLKLDPSGKEVLFSTFIGGGKVDQIEDIVVDEKGNTYITGFTGSSPEDGFPIGNGVPGINTVFEAEWYNAFILILDSSGTKLNYASYIGGKKSTQAYTLSLDDKKNIYIGGNTNCSQIDGFPIGEAIPGYDTTYNSEHYNFEEKRTDAFVMKLDSTGMKVLYSTYLGGKGYNSVSNLQLNSLGLAYCFGALSASQDKENNLAKLDTRNLSSADLWEHNYVNEELCNLVLLNEGGTNVLYSAIIPLKSKEIVHNDLLLIAGDATHNILSQWNIHEGVSGLTQQLKGINDIYTALLDTTNKKLLAATFLGGKDLKFIDHGVDSKGQVYLLGYTKDSTSLVWESEYISATEGLHYRPGSCFLVKLDPTLEKILYASHFESPDRDRKYFGLNMCVDEHEQAYIAGHMPETLKDYSFVMKVDTTIDARASEKTNQDPVREDTQEPTPSSPQVLFWMIFLILLFLLALGWIRVRSKGKKSS